MRCRQMSPEREKRKTYEGMMLKGTVSTVSLGHANTDAKKTICHENKI